LIDGALYLKVTNVSRSHDVENNTGLNCVLWM